MFLFYFFLVSLFSIVDAQQLIKQDGSPVEIYADEAIEWHKNDNKYIAIGNAKAKSGSMILMSDRIEAFYDESDDSAMDIRLVKAHRRVKIIDNYIIINRCGDGVIITFIIDDLNFGFFTNFIF